MVVTRKYWAKVHFLTENEFFFMAKYIWARLLSFSTFVVLLRVRGRIPPGCWSTLPLLSFSLILKCSGILSTKTSIYFKSFKKHLYQAVCFDIFYSTIYWDISSTANTLLQQHLYWRLFYVAASKEYLITRQAIFTYLQSTITHLYS